jgi:hypothetical protein
MLVMERAKWELNSKDITMAILLSAVAVEAQMSWLFFKWKGIDDGLLPHEQTPNYTEKVEGEWTDMRTISKRSDELSRLLVSKEFDKFAQQNMGWLGPQLRGFDSATSVKTFFQNELFEKRNRIVHYGNIDFDEEDGTLCFSLATAFLGLLQVMDRERIKRMDDDHKGACEPGSPPGFGR